MSTSSCSTVQVHFIDSQSRPWAATSRSESPSFSDLYCQGRHLTTSSLESSASTNESIVSSISSQILESPSGTRHDAPNFSALVFAILGSNFIQSHPHPSRPLQRHYYCKTIHPILLKHGHWRQEEGANVGGPRSAPERRERIVVVERVERNGVARRLLCVSRAANSALYPWHSGEGLRCRTLYSVVTRK